jgi:mRNA interferase RelE/StbE
VRQYRLEFTPAALRELEKLDPGVRAKVFSDIEKLAENPRPHGVAKIKSGAKLYRVHLGRLARPTAPSIKLATRSSLSWW